MKHAFIFSAAMLLGAGTMRALGPLVETNVWVQAALFLVWGLGMTYAFSDMWEGPDEA